MLRFFGLFSAFEKLGICPTTCWLCPSEDQWTGCRVVLKRWEENPFNVRKVSDFVEPDLSQMIRKLEFEQL